MNTFHIQGPQEWYELIETLHEGKGIAILLGATDTGKSTLAKFLKKLRNEEMG